MVRSVAMAASACINHKTVSGHFSNRDKHTCVNVNVFLHLDHFLLHLTKQKLNAKFDNIIDDYDKHQ